MYDYGSGDKVAVSDFSRMHVGHSIVSGNFQGNKTTERSKAQDMQVERSETSKGRSAIPNA
jgi:hypothetical protein